MVNLVKKRDGRVEPFECSHITIAIQKAAKSVNEELPDKFYEEVCSLISNQNKTKIGVEEIQDIIEKHLMDNKHYAVAKNFILYREKHKEIRSILEKEEFMKFYIQASNAASGSKYDSNANVTEKNIATLNGEIPKLDYLRLNRKRVMDKLRELYPGFNVKQYEKDLESHILYKHDESSSPGIYPYTYSAKEVVNVKYNDLMYLTALDGLYDLVNYPEKLLDEKDEVYGKFPENLFIQDRDGKFTKVTRLIKKRRHRDLVRIKTEFGEDLVVTDNHPIIISDDKNDTVDAIDGEGKKQFRVTPKIEFGGKKVIDTASIVPYDEKFENFILTRKAGWTPYTSLKRHLSLDEKFGYVIGFFIGDGYFKNDEGGEALFFVQKERETLEKLAEIIYESTGCTTLIREKPNRDNVVTGYTAEVKSFALYYIFKEYFHIRDYAQNKNIPINILQFTREFAKGILEGLIDSDGCVGHECTCAIRLSSRECIMQITSLLKEFGYKPKNGWNSAPFNEPEEKKLIHGNYSLWGVAFCPEEGSEPFEMSYKWKKVTRTAKPKHKDGWVDIDTVKTIPANDHYLHLNEFIYDITTETNTFICNNIWVHNCAAVSMWPFLNDGLKNIGGLSAAPKNIDSFCGMFLHLVFALASQFAGAVAFGEFFNCFDYYARKEWGDHYYKHDNLAAHLKYRKNASGEYETYEISISKQIEQYFQQIVYGLNQPAGNRSYQSPFTNFSYYDKNYWEALFADFCYPDGTKPQWESVSYLQKKFMKWFNQERTKTVLTFPVETMALLSDGKNRILDEEYEKFTAEMYAEGHSFFTYISDNPNGLSSCCFSGEEEIEVYINGSPKKMTIQEYVDSIDSNVNPKGFDVVNGDRILSYSIEDGSKEEVNITGILKKKYSGTMYRIGINSKYITVTGDHPLMVSDIHSNRVLKVLAQDFDFNNHLVALESSNGIDFCKASTYEKEEVENKIVYDIQLEKNHFFSANGIITHNCRLRNEVEDNEFSFTNGLSGVATGSKSVITLNLNRIVQNYAKSKSKDKGEFKEYLVKILDRVYKYHHAYNELLKDLQASNMLPVYNAGFISLNQQFLTIGINGMNEAAEFLGLECSDNPEYQAFVDSVCSTISEQNKLHKTKDMKFNQEYVPAENLGVKNYRWDKEAGYKVPKDRNAYNSYFYLPDNENTEILERFRLQGRRYTQNLDGGVALHCNLQEHLSEEQYLKLMRYAVQEGCSFFTFNVKNSICNDCGYISKHTIDKCPHCGSTNIDWITRIIGYLKRIGNFSEARQQEASRRVYK